MTSNIKALVRHFLHLDYFPTLRRQLERLMDAGHRRLQLSRNRPDTRVLRRRREASVARHSWLLLTHGQPTQPLREQPKRVYEDAAAMPLLPHGKMTP
ncbi:MAG: hypothetical protein ACLQU3_24410 [Limisphaerales bacterium]